MVAGATSKRNAYVPTGEAEEDLYIGSEAFAGFDSGLCISGMAETGLVAVLQRSLAIGKHLGLYCCELCCMLPYSLT